MDNIKSNRGNLIAMKKEECLFIHRMGRRA
jgi:hypothetical protein